ncbi:MAG: PmoA family protein [Verrucomicrobiota bacterium]
MRRSGLLLVLTFPFFIAAGDETVSLEVGGKELVTYQALPLSDHYKGDLFRGSNFIHPLKTPSGFIVTESAPKTDHPHHFGLWWPWKHIEVEGRQVLCWELQRGDGIVEARGAKMVPNGLIGESVYIDRKAPDGPIVRLKEKTKVAVSELVETPASGYFVDLEISQQTSDGETVVVTPYRYSGFAMRGSPIWAGTSTYLTSEGIGRAGSNTSRARWVRIEGPTGIDDERAGVLLMSHPKNQSHPEHLRTWEKGKVFVNFNTVQKEPWVLEPDKSYLRRYRLFVFDGSISADEAERLWEKYADGE